MPDKLTDNEIIKALECCYTYDVLFCDKCPFQEECAEINLGQLAIDLINRLQAENESLKAEVDDWKAIAEGYQKQFEDCYERKQAEIENLQKNFEEASNDRFIYKIRWAKAEARVDKAKAEAYKEFAERLHKELRIYGAKDTFNKLVFLNVVDKAKKELVGEDNFEQVDK